MKKLLILITILLVFTSLSTFAQDEEEVEKDNLELTLWSGLGLPTGDIKTWSDSLGAKSKFSLGMDIGFFYTPDIVIGFNFTYNTFSIDNNPTDTRAEGLNHRLYQPNIYVKYYFPSESNWLPFVKVHGGFDFAKFTTFVENPAGNRYRSVSYDAAFAYGLGAGMFYYTSDYSGLFFEANYHIASTSSTSADYLGTTYEFGDNLKLLDIHLGFRILFGDE